MKEWYERREEQAGVEDEFAITDLQRVLAIPEGYRFVLRLLHRLGAEGHCPRTEYGFALHDLAESILKDCGEASYKTMMYLISDLRSLKYGRNGSEGNE